MLAEVAERDAVGKLVLDQLARSLREQRLAAVRGRADPGGARDIEPDVSGRCNVWLSGVEADPDGQPGRGQLALEPRRGRHGADGARKGGEEGLALGVDLVSSVVGERGSD